MSIDSTPVRDVVIVLPGVMGSELVDADGRLVWSVRAGALANAIRSLGKSLRRLELPTNLGDRAPNDGIRATRLLDSLHVIPGLWTPITGYDGLLRFLGSSRFQLVAADPRRPEVVPNLLSFPYDWRLSNRFNGRLLAEVATAALERWRRQPGMAEAKLVLICHSMGGLVARWFAEQEGGAELIRTLVTIGTPHRGSIHALKTLVNGLEPGLGPLRLDLSRFVRSLPSLYQLLPQYNCLETNEGRIGLLAAGCPGLDAERLRDAAAFHAALAGADEPRYTFHKVVGIRQPTFTTARLVGEEVVPSPHIDGKNQGGDGTVPRLSAEPVAGRGREVYEVADQHGALQSSRALLDLVDGILSRQDIIWQSAEEEGFGVEMDEFWPVGEPPLLRLSDPKERRLLVSVEDELGRTVQPPTPVAADGTARLEPLPEGGYRAHVASGRRGDLATVTKAFVVLDPSAEA